MRHARVVFFHGERWRTGVCVRVCAVALFVGGGGVEMQAEIVRATRRARLRVRAWSLAGRAGAATRLDDNGALARRDLGYTFFLFFFRFVL